MNRCSLAAGLRGNEERMRKWRGNGEEMEREWGNEEEMERKWGNGERLTLYISSFSLYFLPLSPFPPSLSISYIKMHHILLQNVKYGTFVANVTKISTYALWGNNSGSNLLRGSSAIRAGLVEISLDTASVQWMKSTLGGRVGRCGITRKDLFAPKVLWDYLRPMINIGSRAYIRWV